MSLVAVLWAVYGPQGAWTLAWLGVVFVVVTGAALGLHALQPDGIPACGCLCGCPGPGRSDGDGVVCDPCRTNIHQAAS